MDTNQKTGPVNKLIAIGTSAGGVEALVRIVRALPGNLNAAICVTIHQSPTGPALLAQLLSRHSLLPVEYAKDGSPIENGRIYLAPPDKHLRVLGNRLHLDRGPRENSSRPAIDPLFRSAARDFDGDTIGVILSGSLDDGTAGLAELKLCGGTAIVQDPGEATFPGMPESAISRVDVDYVVSLDSLPGLLNKLCQAEIKRKFDMDSPPPSEDTPACYICPECGGPLREKILPDGPHFECLVGHRLTADWLWNDQSKNIETVLWTAVRTLKERADFAKRLAERSRTRGHDFVAKRYEDEAAIATRDSLSIENLIATRETAESHISGSTESAAPLPHVSAEAGENE